MSSRQPRLRQFAHLLNAEEAPGSSASPAGSRLQSSASYPSIPGITKAMQDAFYENEIRDARALHEHCDIEDAWRFIEDDTDGAVLEPRAADPEAGVDNSPPSYPEALAESRERLTKEEQLLFIKTYNNYRFNLKRNGLAKYIDQIQGFVNEVTGRKLRRAKYKNGYKWIMAKMRD